MEFFHKGQNCLNGSYYCCLSISFNLAFQHFLCEAYFFNYLFDTFCFECLPLCFFILLCIHNSIQMSLPLLPLHRSNKELKSLQSVDEFYGHPIPAPSSSTLRPSRGGSMERISGSSCSVSSLARESSIISSTVAALECSFQNSFMLQRTVKH